HHQVAHGQGPHAGADRARPEARRWPTLEYRLGPPGDRFSRRPEMRDRTSTRDAPVGQSPGLPMALRLVQSVSRELVLGELIDKVLAFALEHGAAARALFVLVRDGAQQLAGEATVVHGAATVRVHDDPVAPVDVSAEVLDAVARTREQVLLDDAAGDHQARSILCLPLSNSNEGELLGMLYLESGTPQFTTAQIEMMELLAAQAAISLRHAYFVTSLRQAEEAARGRAEELQ